MYATVHKIMVPIHQPFLSLHSQFLPWSWKCVSCYQDLAVCPAVKENAIQGLLSEMKHTHTKLFNNWSDSAKESYRNFLLGDDDSWVLATDANGGHPSLVDGFESILCREEKIIGNNHPMKQCTKLVLLLANLKYTCINRCKSLHPLV